MIPRVSTLFGIRNVTHCHQTSAKTEHSTNAMTTSGRFCISQVTRKLRVQRMLNLKRMPIPCLPRLHRLQHRLQRQNEDALNNVCPTRTQNLNVQEVRTLQPETTKTKGDGVPNRGHVRQIRPPQPQVLLYAYQLLRLSLLLVHLHGGMLEFPCGLAEIHNLHLKSKTLQQQRPRHLHLRSQSHRMPADSERLGRHKKKKITHVDRGALLPQ